MNVLLRACLRYIVLHCCCCCCWPRPSGDVWRAALCWKMKFSLECLLCELHIVIDLVVIEREREKREMQKSKGQTWPIIASINTGTNTITIFVCLFAITVYQIIFFLPFRFRKKKNFNHSTFPPVFFSYCSRQQDFFFFWFSNHFDAFAVTFRTNIISGLAGQKTAWTWVIVEFWHCQPLLINISLSTLTTNSRVKGTTGECGLIEFRVFPISGLFLCCAIQDLLSLVICNNFLEVTHIIIFCWNI